jgi:RNA polymerase sigma-32 factor
LTDRERLIVCARQLQDQPRTLESLGIELRLSKERIRQLEAAAYGKLRRRLEEEGAGLSLFIG